jgi:ABC-2 type transport system ATP-binding protein
MIEVKNLHKSFGPTRAVDGVSFSMKKGEILGFLGPNGAGKSTTMKILTGYLPYDEGTVEVANFNVDTHPLEVRRRLGYLPENTPLYEEMGVIEFLRFIAAIRKIPRESRTRRLRRVIDMCGLSGVVCKTIGQLSRGYRQRVGLAQALIHDPDILVLDEPTSALDPTQIKEIRDLIRRIGKEKSIILSTHIMQEVTATCDRAIIINKGRVVAEGTPEELMGRGSGERVVSVIVKAARDEAKRTLESVEHVEKVHLVPASEGDGWLRFQITFERKAKDPAVDIYRKVAAAGWTLRELREDKATLEDVFIQLTRETNASGD